MKNLLCSVALVSLVTFCFATQAATHFVTNLNDSGPGSLRQTIADAAIGDAIEFSVTGTIVLSSGPLAVTKTLRISGPVGVLITLDGNHNTTVLNVQAGGVILERLRVINGDGAEPLRAGGMCNQGTNVEVRNCIFENNAGVQGGAIVNSPNGTIKLEDCQILNNRSWFLGGGVSSSGRYFSAFRTVFRGNHCIEEGGAMLTYTPPNGHVYLEDCLMEGNFTRDGYANAIEHEGGPMTLVRCTVANNGPQPGPGHWWARGGGIWNRDLGILRLVHCTISGNRSWRGGGIYNDGQLLLEHSTIVHNSIYDNSELEPSVGEGGGVANLGSARSLNTIIALNRIDNQVDAIGIDWYGPLTSLGYNLIGNNSGAAIAAGPGDQIGSPSSPIDPLLAPLQNNGGFTPTHALLETSPAVDAGTCPDTTGAVNADQRGVSRPQGIRCDIGAFELEAAADPHPPTVVIHQLIAGPPTRLVIRVADVGSGLASIQVVRSVNADTVVPPFQVGTLGPIYVTATKIDQTKSAVVEVLARDVAGNVTRGDPVVTTVELTTGGWIAQRFTGIPAAEGYITVQNGNVGLKKITIRMNTTTWMLHLNDGQTEFLDASAAMIPGDNNVVDLVGNGPPGSSALIVIADSPQAPDVDGDGDSNGRKGKVKQVNLTWGRLAAEHKIEP